MLCKARRSEFSRYSRGKCEGPPVIYRGIVSLHSQYSTPRGLSEAVTTSITRALHDKTWASQVKHAAFNNKPAKLKKHRLMAYDVNLKQGMIEHDLGTPNYESRHFIALISAFDTDYKTFADGARELKDVRDWETSTCGQCIMGVKRGDCQYCCRGFCLRHF